MSQMPEITPELLAQFTANLTDSTPVPGDFGDVFDAWIGGASIAKRAVTIYGQPGLRAEYDKLEAELRLAEAEVEQGVEMAGGEAAAIRAKMGDVHARWVASKSLWTVQAIEPSRVEELRLEDPVLVEPVAPAPVPDDAPEAVRAAAQTAVEAYRLALVRHRLEVAFRVAAEVVETIEYTDGRTQTGITVDQLRRLAGVLGSTQVFRLSNVAQVSGAGEVTVPAPFSRPSSSSTETS